MAPNNRRSNRKIRRSRRQVHEQRYDWNPSDLLLGGKFCDLSQLQIAVDELREQLNAKFVLALPFDRYNALPKLASVSSDASIVEKNVLDALERLITHQLDERTRSEEGTLLEWLKNHDVLSSQTKYFAARAAHSSEISMQTLNYWLISENAEVKRLGYESKRLLSFLNGTEIANLRRDQSIAKTIRQSFDPNSAELDQTAVLVSSARYVIQADASALYTISRNPTDLKLEYFAPSSCGHLPEEIPVDGQVERSSVSSEVSRLVAKAFSQSASLIDPDPHIRSANFQFHEDHDDDRGQSDLCTIAIPVPYGAVDYPKLLNLGVLVVQRSTQQNFSQFELATLRNLALRISISHRIDTQKNISKHIVDFAAEITEQSNIMEHDSPGRGPHWFPSDYESARPMLTRIADELFQATPSASVTVRFVVPSSEEKKSIFSSKRFLAIPAERMDDDDAELPLQGLNEQRKPYYTFSANVNVATDGAAAYWPDDGMLRSTAGVQNIIRTKTRSTRSELCVPIFDGRHLIGTINLESPREHAYRHSLDVALSFAALAGLAVAMSREGAMAAVARRAAAERIGPHEVDNARKSLSFLKKQFDVNNEEALKRIDEILDLVTRFDEPRAISAETESGVSVKNLILSIKDSLELNVVTMELDQGADKYLSERKYSVVRVVLEELMINVTRHSDTHARCSMRLYEVVQGGNDYLVLVLANVTEKKYLPDHVRKIYRTPVSTSSNPRDRPHLGCYMVGEMIRKIGGDIFMSFDPFRGNVRSFLLIPYSKG